MPFLFACHCVQMWLWNSSNHGTLNVLTGFLGMCSLRQPNPISFSLAHCIGCKLEIFALICESQFISKHNTAVVLSQNINFLFISLILCFLLFLFFSLFYSGVLERFSRKICICHNLRMNTFYVVTLPYFGRYSCGSVRNHGFWK